MKGKLESWQNPLHPDFKVYDYRWVDLTIDQRRGFMAEAHAEEEIENGYSVHGVFPTGPGGFHFGYTTGLSPVLFVAGTSTYAKAIIDSVIEYLLVPDHRVFRLADYEPGDAEFMFLPVPLGLVEPWTHDGGRTRQVVWQSESNGSWPWQEQHPSSLDGSYPVFGVPPEALR